MKITVVGSSNTDMIIKMPRIPVPGETILGGKFSTAAGGKGANQAVGAARAGGDVTFVARVGDDMFGEQACKGFESDGINVEFVKVDTSEPSGVALIFVDDNGQNSIAVASGANGALSPEDVEAAKTTIESSDILLMQLETSLNTIQRAAEIGKAAGVKVILNPAPACILGEEVLSNLSMITPNESEAELLTGIPVTDEASAEKAAQALLDKGMEAVIITMGSQGSFLKTTNLTQFVPAFKVKAVDATGAGDIFNGSLCVALAEGKSYIEAMQFASAAAALSVQKLGAQPSAPAREEIDNMLEES